MAEPPWAEGKTISELGKLISEVQIHLASGAHRHKRHEDDRLVDLMGAIVLQYLGTSDPLPRESWRPQIITDLEAVPYRKGCCTWRD